MGNKESPVVSETTGNKSDEFPHTEKLINRWNELKAEGYVDLKTYPELYPETTVESFCESVNAILDGERVPHIEGLFKPEDLAD